MTSEISTIVDRYNRNKRKLKVKKHLQQVTAPEILLILSALTVVKATQWRDNA